ncbi:hypothetical protein [Pacificoceanicola onchidii]|uniref:hypothetical protein n=1 Tax=Pacificoceanicola onchidii TaxID=2562685 RepID=UPI0010A5E6FE|nr:hypothetical protein [Pacificoceanicola onchidii]
MATYIANNASRDTVTVTLSKAEAEALLTSASLGEDAFEATANGMTRAAYSRASDALYAATNTSARRAGFFD